MALDEVARGSALIFEGRVLGLQTEPPGQPRRIFTRVTFEVLEVIKGEYAGETVDLWFLGGRWRDSELRVTDQFPPRLGEEGIYFVESLQQGQVHPLYGWSQGHYLIEREVADQRRLIKTRDQRPVYAIESASRTRTSGLSKGAAAGIRTSPVRAGDRPMDVETFKQSLRWLLESRP